MYSFSAVLGDCKVASYDTFILLSFTSGGQSLRWFSLVSAGRIPSRGSVSLPFPVSGDCLCSLAHGLFLCLQSQQDSISKFFFDSDSSAPFFSHLRIHVIYWAHPHNLEYSPYFKVSWLTTLIPSVTIILLCHALERIHWFWGLRHGYIWETLIHLTTHYFLQSWEAFNKYLFFEYFWILKYLLSWILGFLHLYMYFMTFAINYFSFWCSNCLICGQWKPFQVGS